MQCLSYFYLLFFLVSTCLFANGQGKIGYLHLDSLRALLPETKTADSLFDIAIAKLSTEVKERELELEELYKAMTNDIVNTHFLSDSIVIRVNAAKNSLDSFLFTVQKQAEELMKNKYVNIDKKIKKAVEEIALGYGFSLIYDSGKLGVLFYDKEYNIIEEVKAKLLLN